MVFISFNVNGIRSAINDGLSDFLKKSVADFILLQEIKVNFPIDLNTFGYKSIWNFSKRKGYSGTAILFKNTPLDVQYGFAMNHEIDDEGRIITLEYPAMFVIDVYFPNSQGDLDRWYYRLDWFSAVHEHLSNLYPRKLIIVGGDFNLAHSRLDIYPKAEKDLKDKSGFTEEERGEFDNLIEMGFVDTFRFLHPEERAYTWWSKSNENYKYNRGRRLDYFLVSEKLAPKIRESSMMSGITISDHVPIKLELKL